ncbi:MAG TPA: hypothetical protein VHD90_13260 [Phototrophicaceae bacterium]|nr:hypothetical protein [Phototrophicaceae bacterium]
MIRLLTVTAALLLAFVLTLALIVAQPRDDSPIRSFFLPTARCVAPCFMGIRPGTTSSVQAQAILQASAWVAQVSADANTIQWTWNGRQPAFLSGDPADNQMTLNRGIVYSIDVGTSMDMATIRLAFGKPDLWLSLSSMMLSSRSSPTAITYLEQRALYGAYNIEVSTAAQCPLAINGQWGLITRITMPMEVNYPGFSPSWTVIPPLPKDCA